MLSLFRAKTISDMAPTATFKRRQLLRLLETNDLSRREQVRVLARTPGLGEWILTEAERSGLETTRLEIAVGRLGTGWTRRAVKRFFLSACPS